MIKRGFREKSAFTWIKKIDLFSLLFGEIFKLKESGGHILFSD